MDKADEIKVFITTRERSTCGECSEELSRGAWITLQRDKGALCLTCADLDHLTFLPTGDAALTRRARKHSALSAVVLKFSRARKRYERQGLLVEESALQQAETECLADSEIRARRAEREQIRREELDQQYIEAFASPAAAKSFDEEAVRLAVIAHIRHRETDYDQLLGKGWFRHEARAHVRGRVEQISESWK